MQFSAKLAFKNRISMALAPKSKKVTHLGKYNPSLIYPVVPVDKSSRHLTSLKFFLQNFILGLQEDTGKTFANIEIIVA